MYLWPCGHCIVRSQVTREQHEETKRKRTKRLRGMKMQLQRYDVEVVYLQGNQMFLANILSPKHKAYLTVVRPPSQEEFEQVNIAHLDQTKKLREIKYATEHDGIIQVLKRVILQWWPGEKHDLPTSVMPLFNFREELTSQGGLIFKGTRFVNTLHQLMKEKIYSSDKILEKVVASRLRSHISSNCLSNVSQSAYKEFHSETALLKVHNDVTLNIDKGKVTALTLLSAAFDTIDHAILIKRLSLWYGISGTALSWFLSYLTGRHQTIKIANCFSAAFPTSCGVPQGSVLGPLLFTLYTTPLSSVIQNHNLDHHLYADDTYIYISLATSDTNRSLNQLSDCLQDIFLWMTDSKLKLNADKTEFLIIGTPKQCGKLDGFFPTCILNQTIIPAASANNLGVTFDKNFNFRQHISQTCRCCFYHIRDLRRIRRYMSLSVAKTIATALVSSRLDYCNSLLHNIAIKDITKLQRVQNCLARVVTRSPRFSRPVPLLKSLHWLPVRYRIIFKICTITYQALSTKQPAYLHSMLTPARQPRQLRSSGSGLLFVPRVKTNAGTRAFSVAAPTLWNSLPDSVKSARNIASFRRNLKTYLFKMAYPP